MPGIYIAESRQSIQYTGANSAAIDAAITDFTIVSEAGGVLDFTSQGNPFTVNTGDWINFWQGYVNGTYTNSQFGFYFIQSANPADISALQAQQATNTANIATNTANIAAMNTTLTTLGGQALRSAGVASAGTLLLGFPQNVAVQLVPAMPNTSYTPQAYIFGTGVNLSQVTINSVTKTSASVVTVNVSTSIASLPGVHVLVTVRS